MADANTQNGLSNGPVNDPGTVQSPAMYSSPTRPADIIRQRQANKSAVATYQYPDDLPKYYFSFSVSSYKRDTLMKLGDGNLLYVASLPLPDRMLDSNDVAFNKTSFSATIGTATNLIAGGLDTRDPDGSDNAKGGALGVVGTAFLAETAKTLTGGQGSDVARAFTGYSPNYFLTQLLDGPQYKRYSLSWTFSPQNPKEAAELTRLLRMMKNAQAPGISNGQAFFKFPRIFRCWYSPDRAHLHQFKPAILKGLAIDYSGGGLPAMRAGRPETGNMGAPAVIKMTANFEEMEFWLRSDFGSDTDPNDEFANRQVGGDGGGRSVD